MSTGKLARVTVGPLPHWLDAARLCGAEPSRYKRDERALWVELELTFERAAQLCAQLRGLGFAGQAVSVAVVPTLRREEVRAGRLAEARARRHGSAGFSDTRAHAEGEGRFSLTPEALALELGARARGRTVVDACGGSGGNALGFARGGARVQVVEISPERRAEIAHNARIYAVDAAIEIIAGDALQEVPNLSADILFIDPPWGEHYDKTRAELSAMPLLCGLLGAKLNAYGEIWLKVPPSFDVNSLPEFSVEAWFGAGPGDASRVKFLLLTRVGAPGHTSTRPMFDAETADADGAATCPQVALEATER
jgi:hypothetical protein